MQLSNDDPLVRTAVFGRQVEDFLGSDVGRYIAQRASDEIDAAMHALKTASPSFWWGRRKIARLQEQIAVAERVIGWLADAVTEGRQATQTLGGSND